MVISMNDDKRAYQPMQRLSRRYLKWAVYGAAILLAVILQSLPRLFPSVGGARPILVIPVVVCIAMFEGPIGGAAAGIAGGILWDLFSDRLLGFNALLLLFICCACGLMAQLLIRNNLLSSLLMTAAALFSQGILDWFFNVLLLSKSEPLYTLLHLTLPNMLYSFLLTPILYFIIYALARKLRSRE